MLTCAFITLTGTRSVNAAKSAEKFIWDWCEPCFHCIESRDYNSFHLLHFKLFYITMKKLYNDIRKIYVKISTISRLIEWNTLSGNFLTIKAIRDFSQTQSHSAFSFGDIRYCQMDNPKFFISLNIAIYPLQWFTLFQISFIIWKFFRYFFLIEINSSFIRIAKIFLKIYILKIQYEPQTGRKKFINFTQAVLYDNYTVLLVNRIRNYSSNFAKVHR